MNPFRRRKALLEALAISSAVWAAFAVALWVWLPPLWPWRQPGDLSREDVALFVWIVQFLLVKSWLMFRRTRFRTPLGWSLIAVNAGFATVYFIALIFAFWPSAQAADVKQAMRVVLAVIVLWTVVELTLTEDQAEEVETPQALIDGLRLERDALRVQVAALEVQLAEGGP